MLPHHRTRQTTTQPPRPPQNLHNDAYEGDKEPQGALEGAERRPEAQGHDRRQPIQLRQDGGLVDEAVNLLHGQSEAGREYASGGQGGLSDVLQHVMGWRSRRMGVSTSLKSA